MADLTPAQQEVLARLRVPGAERPRYRPELRDELRARLEAELRPLVADLDGPVVLNKTRLGRLHACESYDLAELAAPFTWTPRTAKGAVAHKAIELSVHVPGHAPPLALVDLALRRLEDGDERSGPGAFLRTADPGERAEVRALANDLVARFLELWPPLEAGWRPVTESSLRAELADARVVLLGKVDLTLGHPVGTEARRVVIDLKSGGHHASHLDDLRLYALLETLRCGVPPLRVAGYSLDAGTFQAEDVTEGVLEAAVRRTVAGVRKVAELRLGLRPPTVVANPACAWCRAPEGCEGRAAWDERRLALSLGA